MATILVTGMNGQVGREFGVLTSDFSQHNFIFTGRKELDITSPKSVSDFFEKHSIEYLINCAAYTSVDDAESDWEAAQLVNGTALRYLGTFAARYGVKVISFSTDYVFSGNTYLPYTEDDKPDPISKYGKSKLEGEHELFKVCKEGVIVRTSWLYSPFGKNFLRTLIRLGKENDELNVVFDQVGTPTYAKDLCDVVMQIIDGCERGVHKFVPGIYNYSNEGVCSWYDFAYEIQSLAQTSCKINPIESKDFSVIAPRPHYGVLNKSKIKHTFDIEIPHWRTSLSGCFNRL